MMASGPGTETASGRENYLMLPAPVCPMHSGVAHPHGPLYGDWLQMFHLLGHLIWQPWT